MFQSYCNSPIRNNFVRHSQTVCTVHIGYDINKYVLENWEDFDKIDVDPCIVNKRAYDVQYHE